MDDGVAKVTPGLLARRLRVRATLVSCGAVSLALSTCSPHTSTTDRVEASRMLRVATINSPTTCYQTPNGESGYECDLLRGLAAQLGVALHIEFFDSPRDVERAVATGEADMGAAGFVIPSDAQDKGLRFTSPIGSVSEQLVYHRGDHRPSDLADLRGGVLHIALQSNANVLVPQLRVHNQPVKAEVNGDAGAEDLLYQVAQGRMAYTISDSTLVALNQHYYPDIAVAFDVAPRQPMAWILGGGDPAFFSAVEHYLDTGGTTQMERAYDRYFSPREDSDYQGIVHFSADVRELLPVYRGHFEDASKKTGIDWRLLAAIGYQESHWDAAAVSPTGVRGLMMLTSATASYLDVSNRASGRQSIGGGSRYFGEILAALPTSIQGQDRINMALAAYNLGIGHILDVRKITVKLGGDPDRWRDVSRALPLLMQERWYKNTDCGYARGREALGFVENVNNYYDILTWITDGQSASLTQRNGPINAAAVSNSARGSAAAGAASHVKS